VGLRSDGDWGCDANAARWSCPCRRNSPPAGEIAGVTTHKLHTKNVRQASSVWCCWDGAVFLGFFTLNLYPTIPQPRNVDWTPSPLPLRAVLAIVVIAHVVARRRFTDSEET
jgi:hypothetical protein